MRKSASLSIASKGAERLLDDTEMNFPQWSRNPNKAPAVAPAPTFETG